MEKQSTTCCIAGGGPAGMMLGYLLARAGVDVVVLEKHADFLRDFRGDTVHPSTLQVMHELGLLKEFLKRPHQKAYQLAGQIGGHDIVIADFSYLRTTCPFVAMMPQWDFLDFLATEGKRYPNFHLRMQAETNEFIEESGRIAGLRVKTPRGMLEIRADLVIGADGRHSTVRDLAGFIVEDLGAPIDVLWMRIPRKANDPSSLLGRINQGKIFAMIDRGDYWQCGYVIAKGGYDELRKKGLESLHENITALAPFLGDRIAELSHWDDIKLLTVSVNRLKRWHQSGLLCIGDAAHAMSPIGGVGINLAVQDAVAAANILAVPLKNKTLTETDLAKVQRRRTFPTRMTQGIQIFMQNRVMARVLGSDRPLALPWQLKLLQWFPPLRAIPAYLVGIGFRPEHIKDVN